MGEVEERLERQLPGEYPALAGRQPRRRNAAVGLQQAADLGRQREAVAGIAPENVADAVLAEPVAVERRRIEVPDAGLVRRDHGIERRLLVERRIEVPQDVAAEAEDGDRERSEEHTSELQSLMRISYAVFCLKKKKEIIK